MDESVVRRRFSIADVMILMAMAAVLIAPMRWFLRNGHFTASGLRTIAMVVVALLPGAALMTAAMLMLRLRQPRPPLHELARQDRFGAVGIGSLFAPVGGLIFLTLL